jgi:Signal transduction histidine kinase
MLAGFVAVAVIGGVGYGIARRASNEQAIRNARDLTEADARSIEDRLIDDVVRGDPAARAALNRAIRDRVLSARVVRVKVWTGDGRIVASDARVLVGQQFRLRSEEQTVLRTGGVDAEASDLSRPENARERHFGKLLEVYVGTHTTTGTPMLFEAYVRYDAITANGDRLLIAFAPALVGGLLLLWLAQLPLAAALVRRLRRSQDRERALMTRAIESSERERRRIAADLHDSVVQDLAGSSMSLTAIARTLRQSGDARLADDLDARARDLRQNIRDLRTLVVAIAPRRLHEEGLAAALEDLASTARARGIAASVAVDADLPLDRTGEALLYRGAQEAVRNTMTHTDAASVDIAVTESRGAVRLRVHDDGDGFDTASPTAVADDHVGLRLLAELAGDVGGTLDVQSAPGAGTTLVLEVPTR